MAEVSTKLEAAGCSELAKGMRPGVREIPIQNMSGWIQGVTTAMTDLAATAERVNHWGKVREEGAIGQALIALGRLQLALFIDERNVHFRAEVV